MYFSPEQIEKFRKDTKEQKPFSMTFICKACFNSCGIAGRKLIAKRYICKTCVEKINKDLK